jgi:hypothetical protein
MNLLGISSRGIYLTGSVMSLSFRLVLRRVFSVLAAPIEGRAAAPR